MREAGPGGALLGQAVPSAQLPPTPFSSVSVLLPPSLQHLLGPPRWGSWGF